MKTPAIIPRASTSFTERELLALDALLRTVRRGGDGKQIAKSPELTAVARKVQAGLASCERNRGARYAMTERGGDAPPARGRGASSRRLRLLTLDSEVAAENKSQADGAE
jgi:hypothetical protein